MSIRGFTAKSNFIFFVGIVGKSWEMLGISTTYDEITITTFNRAVSNQEPTRPARVRRNACDAHLQNRQCPQHAPRIRHRPLTWRPTRISSHRSPRHIGATQNPTSRCQASFDYVKDHRRTRITHRPSLSNYLLTIYVIKKHLKAIILHKFVFGKRRRLEILVEPCQ